MRTGIGTIEAIFRYPVKSMRSEALAIAMLGWHGLEGDRRLALRRRAKQGDFHWLTASKLPELVLYAPVHREAGRALPTHVVTPDGKELPIFEEQLADEIGRLCGEPVELTHLNHGIFDEASISVITCDTVREVCRLAETGMDIQRFRPNIVVRSARATPFEEDAWVGGLLTFGEAEDAPAVAATLRDARCAMVCIDPDTGKRNPDVLKAVVRANGNNAGIYGTVVRTGTLAVGQNVFLHRWR